MGGGGERGTAKASERGRGQELACEDSPFFFSPVSPSLPSVLFLSFVFRFFFVSLLTTHPPNPPNPLNEGGTLSHMHHFSFSSAEKEGEEERIGESFALFF